MHTDSAGISSGFDLDAADIQLHESRDSWIPRQAWPRDFGIARHWSRRRREAAYGRLSRIAVLARTQH
jgi:hypothetical protein